MCISSVISASREIHSRGNLRVSFFELSLFIENVISILKLSDHTNKAEDKLKGRQFPPQDFSESELQIINETIGIAPLTKAGDLGQNKSIIAF